MSANCPQSFHETSFIGICRRFIRSLLKRSILISFAKAPTPADVETHRAKTFVRQLEIIAVDFEDQMAAISNYFKAALDRTNWGVSGMVQKESF